MTFDKETLKEKLQDREVQKQATIYTVVFLAGVLVMFLLGSGQKADSFGDLSPEFQKEFLPESEYSNEELEPPLAKGKLVCDLEMEENEATLGGVFLYKPTNITMVMIGERSSIGFSREDVHSQRGLGSARSSCELEYTKELIPW